MTKFASGELITFCCDRGCSFFFFPVNVIVNPYYSLAMFLLCSQCVKYAHNTHAVAIPELRTQCTRGVIYYPELTIPRTITASQSNRLKMAAHGVYAQTHKEVTLHTVGVVQTLLAVITCVMENKDSSPQTESIPVNTVTKKNTIYFKRLNFKCFNFFLGQLIDDRWLVC